ncbi:uncharacterized protein LOC119324977 isoform X1 [Triticum dicoccoides]|uniref:uncharacterized protein LOC119324977 isoform X1 n=1 Tax=Triticum dicoccoides TaxID=85692 RepID=UPI001890E8BA|nr:uncharacterized protein LOC119324977 isoform X1 [Triticum dicoccoides]
MPPCVAGCHVAAVEAATGHRGRDGDADRLQRAARRLLLHGGQVRRGGVPRLRAHAPGLQGRLRRHGDQAALLRPRLQDARPSLVEDVRQGLLPQGKVKAGHEYDDATFEGIFGQIYAAFGSPAPYSVFPDARPFLRWLRGEGIMAGVVTNADCRYRDVVLPALGLNQGSEWDFGVFSGVAGVEKPDRRIYEMALEAAGGVAPEEALHIGDSMSKDYAPARAVGMHALVLDRFGTADAERWRRSGAVVLPDLVSAREWLTRDPPAAHGGTNNAGAEEWPF